jgi:hypothetical protein
MLEQLGEMEAAGKSNAAALAQLLDSHSALLHLLTEESRTEGFGVMLAKVREYVREK